MELEEMYDEVEELLLLDSEELIRAINESILIDSIVTGTRGYKWLD